MCDWLPPPRHTSWAGWCHSPRLLKPRCLTFHGATSTFLSKCAQERGLALSASFMEKRNQRVSCWKSHSWTWCLWHRRQRRSGLRDFSLIPASAGPLPSPWWGLRDIPAKTSTLSATGLNPELFLFHRVNLGPEANILLQFQFYFS